MSIKNQQELHSMKAVSSVVAQVLNKMCERALPGTTTYALDQYGKNLLKQFGAKSAPKKMYGFPGYTCISINHEVAHGIPSERKVIQAGDLVNIDVSAEKDGLVADNGMSFIVGNNPKLQALVDASKSCLQKAIAVMRPGAKISMVGRAIQEEAGAHGFRVIKNLAGHGVGRKLHEHPVEIPCFEDLNNHCLFEENMVVAIETFVSNGARYASQLDDGWTLSTTDGSFVAQHEHTILITSDGAEVLTFENGIF